MTVISFDRVSHHFGERAVIDDVTTSLQEHRVGIIGGNGSGKSTLARMINGLIVPDTGSVTVDGFGTRKQGREVRRRVGFVFTDPDNQIVMPTVAEDVAFSLRRSGLSKAEIAARVDDLLSRFGLLGHRDHPAHQLSGGQKQLLALSSVLVSRPAVVVLDEPTTLLDLRNSREVAALLAELEVQIVLVTHHLELLAEYDRVLVVDGGRVVADDSPAEAIGFYRRLIG